MVVGCQPFLLFLRQLLNCIFTSHGVLSILKYFIVSQSHRTPAFCVFCPFSAVVSHYTHLKIHRPSCIQGTIRAAHHIRIASVLFRGAVLSADINLFFSLFCEFAFFFCIRKNLLQTFRQFRPFCPVKYCQNGFTTIYQLFCLLNMFCIDS